MQQKQLKQCMIHRKTVLLLEVNFRILSALHIEAIVVSAVSAMP